MNWSKLVYTKTQVRKAGQVLADEKSDNMEVQAAYKTLVNWRATHAYPMQTVLTLLRKKAFEIYVDAVVVQRLKRYPSIVAKLKRYPSMGLDRMQDIAGCRAVVSDIVSVYALRDALVKSRSRNTIKKEDDYISNPQASGYRGIHLVYVYKGGHTEYHGLPVELQLRSKAQHSWATAVEVVGTFLKESLKSNQGNQNWLNFFECAGEAFACLESSSKFERLNELEQYIKTLNVFDKLAAFAVATNTLASEQADKSDFYLFILNIEHKTLNYIQFKKSNLEDGLSLYNQFESEFRTDPTRDAVLVSVDSVESLRQAYPNYFADTSEFVNNLKKVLGLI